jgi:spore cortex biosynthesis protein YabQ
MVIAGGSGGGQVEFSTQVKTFFVIAATGVLLGVLFDIYRILRLRFRPHWLITTVADLVYCLLAAAIAFAALLVSNWGEFRFYVVIALVSGVLFYYRLASRYVMNLLISLFKFAANVLRQVKRIVSIAIIKPVIIIGRAIFWPFSFMSKRCRTWYKRWRPPPPPPEEIPPE